ncbi:hypothetical protein WR25_05100 [Diploscapter pachys]|uniref:Galactose-1-phosphate uridylyltransferase n=1 Tax=Diploscapter pachys TaxID=2018661 RepID=A0A2A2J805_9BILA|nr:hypothetical protein WR25_05100 [Diploscapter pachys]
MATPKNNKRRYNPLLDEWVIVAENRVNRPWQGAVGTKPEPKKSDDGKPKENPIAPGGQRANGNMTPEYTSTYVFDNDFPSFTDFGATGQNLQNSNEDGLFKEEEVRGTCRVICYHPDSEKTLATMTKEEALGVVKVWTDQYKELEPKWKWVQIFENRGAAVGCSNLHPHGQLWASNFLPTLAAKKDETQRQYFEKTGKVMLVEYLQLELAKKDRIVVSNQHWTVLVPFWAFWPFETMLLPNRHVTRFTEISEEEKLSLAEILQELIVKYDNIFECYFPYSMGWLGAPSGDRLKEENKHWQLHASFHPPLLRSATVPKYQAGYEVFAEKQRDITPEFAAAHIRQQPTVHYTFK